MLPPNDEDARQRNTSVGGSNMPLQQISSACAYQISSYVRFCLEAVSWNTCFSGSARHRLRRAAQNLFAVKRPGRTSQEIAHAIPPGTTICANAVFRICGLREILVRLRSTKYLYTARQEQALWLGLNHGSLSNESTGSSALVCGDAALPVGKRHGHGIVRLRITIHSMTKTRFPHRRRVLREQLKTTSQEMYQTRQHDSVESGLRIHVKSKPGSLAPLWCPHSELVPTAPTLGAHRSRRGVRNYWLHMHSSALKTKVA